MKVNVKNHVLSDEQIRLRDSKTHSTAMASMIDAVRDVLYISLSLVATMDRTKVSRWTGRVTGQHGLGD